MTLIKPAICYNLTRKKANKEQGYITVAGLWCGLARYVRGSCRAHQILFDAGLGPGFAFWYFCNSS